MPRNEAPDNTVMRDVPPGDETGVYYIIISGLPFGTIWQLLKDWLRHAGCDVDHIEVFQKSTSGWVRLIGKDNFERALRHLQTVPYNNRLLLYLDKNRSESVKIMELIDDPPPKPKLGGGSQASRGKSKFRAHQHHADQEQGRPHAAAAAAAPPSGRYPPGPGPGPGPAAGPAPGAAPAPMPAGGVSPVSCYYGVAAPEPAGMADESPGRYGVLAEPFFGPGGWGLQYAPVYAPAYRSFEQPRSPAPPARDMGPSCRHGRADAAGHRPSKPSSPAWAASTARTVTPTPDGSPRAALHSGDERCRVQLVPVRQGASARDVEEWVRSSMGEWASAVSRVDVLPGDHQRGRARASSSSSSSSSSASAYVTFLSSAAAKRAVELLNQKPLLGRVVHARLADEGGDRSREQGRRCDARPAGASGSARQSEDGQGGSASGQREPGAKADAKNAPPVIAHGTSYRPKS